MDDLLATRSARPVAVWLLTGVFMIMMQVVLGGITRLTGSGLSITEWAPIMGAIPPLNHHEWMAAFDLYRQTPQYRLMHADFTLADFQFIFFWEWFHRLWARLLGVVFLIPFVIFLWQGRFTRRMSGPLLILLLLGGLQGLVGWIMVQSGLVGDRVSVNHLKLTVHFMAAMLLLCYTLWFALRLTVRHSQRLVHTGLRRLSLLIFILLTLQLIYGGFMAGLHAALAAPTWPSINGMAVPAGMDRITPFYRNLTDNLITVQFIHRGLAYVLFLLILWWWRMASRLTGQPLLRRLAWLPPAVACLQVLLGILTVLGAHGRIPITLAAAHQFTGMLLLSVMLLMVYLLPRRRLTA